MKNILSRTALAAVVLMTYVACSSVTTPTTISEDDKANAFFEKAFQEQVALSPMTKTYLGMKDDYDKWDDLSDAAADRQLALSKQHLDELKNTVNYDALSAQSKLSYDLFVKSIEEDVADQQWRYHNYPVNQMFGLQSQVPSFLINMHQVSELSHAQDYIARLNGVNLMFDQLIEQLKKRESLGIVAPNFVHEKVINDSQNVISGQPFVSGDEVSPIMADFTSKVDALNLDGAVADKIMADASDAMLTSVKPGYEKLIAYMTAQKSRATADAGAWKFPDGESFYNNALKRTTTTTMNSEEIHQLGLSEVARIHNEMREIMKQVDFDGDLQAFFKYVDDPKFYLSSSEEDRAEFLKRSNDAIDEMSDRLDDLFNVKPEADLIVKAVEPFREKSAGTAFYQSPALDGSRPGIYYVNLYNPTSTPVYEIEALAYHEGVPGHHMQLAIAQELEGIPTFRKLGGYTAYTEGWGLYSEYLPIEYGFYADPYSNFGRLSMELWRAIRLVVDTGLHAKRWTREQAIQYILDTSPTEQADAAKAIERYIVMPSQATAYKIGMLKIIELKNKATASLGDNFDIREFHDVVLKNGAVPLDVLETLVDDYIQANS